MVPGGARRPSAGGRQPRARPRVPLWPGGEPLQQQHAHYNCRSCVGPNGYADPTTERSIATPSD
eukprot:10913889-Lingulodinium_polyedra.AAC.1